MDSSRSAVRRTGFSLVEVLVVIAMIVLLASLMLPAVKQIREAGDITAAANKLSDSLNFARQHSIAKNELIEFRLFQKRDPETDAPSVVHGSPVFDSYQTAQFRDGQWVPIDRKRSLPEGVVINGNELYSQLLPGLSANSSSGLEERAFRFRPDGSTTIDLQAENLGLVILRQTHLERDGPGLPANYAVVVVDPITGVTRTYRP